MLTTRNCFGNGWIAAVCVVLSILGAVAQEPTKPEKSQPSEDKAINLADVTVTATPEKDRNYDIRVNQTATRTDIPTAKTPASLQIIPRAVIEDQGVNRLRDAWRNSSGVAAEKTEGFALQFENAFIRGFSQRMFLDGTNLYATPPIDMAGVQQIEILKGPASVLYGAGEPGGLINIVPRLADFTNRSQYSMSFGSYESYRATIDTNSVLSDDMALRVIGAWQNSESFRDYKEDVSTFLAPSFTYKISPETKLTAWLWYQNMDQPNDDGVAFDYYGNPVQDISQNRAGPDHNSQAIDDLAAGITIEHDLSSSATLRTKFLYHSFEAVNDKIRYIFATSATNTVTPRYDASSFDVEEMKLVVDALMEFELAGMDHSAVMGMDWNRFNYLYSPKTDNTLTPISIYATSYPTGPFSPVEGNAVRTITEQVGAFVQDCITFNKRLHLLVGGRADYVHQRVSSTSKASQHDLAYSGRVGGLYELSEWISPYVSVSSSFNPTGTNRQDVNNNPLDPETGLQYETGFKCAFFDNSLSVTTAVYEVTKDDVAIADPDNPGFYINGGELRSRGAELDVLGQITNALQVIGNYAYTDTKVLDSDSLPEGARFRNIPLHSGSLWTKYTFQDGSLHGLGLGLGVFAASSKPGDTNNSFDLDGYARVDSGIWYSHAMADGRSIKLGLNVFNIFNKEYYESSYNTARVQPGTPRSAEFTVSMTF